MMSGRAGAFLLLMCLLVYNILFDVGWISSRSASLSVVELDRNPKSLQLIGHDTILPAGITAIQACASLQLKYNINTAADLAASSKSIRHHWNVLLCNSPSKQADSTTILESLPPPLPRARLAPVPATASASGSGGGVSVSSSSGSKDEGKELRSVWGEKPALKMGDGSTAVSSSSVAFTRPTSLPAKKALTVTSRCKKMHNKYGVNPGTSWGSLSAASQIEWERMSCDTEVLSEDEDNEGGAGSGGRRDAVEGFLAPAPVSALLPVKDLSPTKSLPSDIEGAGGKDIGKKKQSDLPSVDQANSDWCSENLAKYEVQPMRDWGTLPIHLIDAWRQKKCDMNFSVKRMSSRPLSKCLNTDKSVARPRQTYSDKRNNNNYKNSTTAVRTSGSFLLRTILSTVEVKDEDVLHNLASDLPLVSVMAATTTRRVQNPSPSNMALFMYLLPSLVRSLDCGYRYEYVLGYDKGDPFYDTVEGMMTVHKWFLENVQQPMMENGIRVSLKPVKVNNTIKKPGPVFLEMARAAYLGGAEYFYRINDDTELVANWAAVFVKALNASPSSLGPLGVVGPTCTQGNSKILTHDFVNRLHMDVFEMNYYPPELTDWWMDDWISLVYGMKRTFKAKAVTVVHHTGAHGQRYEVDKTHEHLLESLVLKGRQKIRRWMLKQLAPEEVMKEFDNDEYKAGFKHTDVPGGLR